MLKSIKNRQALDNTAVTPQMVKLEQLFYKSDKLPFYLSKIYAQSCRRFAE